MYSPLRAYDEINMLEAIKEAQKATNEGKMPFGAVLADDCGNIICRAHNEIVIAATGERKQQEKQPSQRGGAGVGKRDVTRHAEIELIRSFTTSDEAGVHDRANCTLYTSTEPCVMCAGAIYWSGIGRVVYGCSAKELEKISGPGGFDIPVEKLYGMAGEGCRKILVTGPVLQEQALQVHLKSGVWRNHNQDDDSKNDIKTNMLSAAEQDIAVEASLLSKSSGSSSAVSNDINNNGAVPIIDLSIGTTEEIGNQLWEAATKVGFFTIIGHGIDQSIIDDVFSVSETFFTQSLEDKKQQSPLDMSLNCGYEYCSQVRPSTGLADQKESLQITARQGSMDNRWPNLPRADFKQKVVTLFTEAHSLACRILDILEPMATPHVEPKTLSSSHTLWGDDGQCTLRLLHYLPQEPDITSKLRQDGYWRAGAHTDWDNITLLFQRPGHEGLECCANPRTFETASVSTKQNLNQMKWTEVNPIKGGIAVNIGDMLSRWSSGKLYSNLHRVRLPNENEANKSRYSIAFFAQSDKKTIISSSNDKEYSSSITAGDYILSRIKSNFSNIKQNN